MRRFLLLVTAWALAGFGGLSSALSQSVESTPVYIEDSPDADELVKQAQHLREQNRLTEAAAMYQKIATDFGQKLMKLEGPVFLDALRWARATLAGDAELLKAYRALQEPAAARLVEQATGPTPDLAQLESIASRYLLCESGLEATLRAAALRLERANPVDAANLLDEVAAHADLKRHLPRWHLLQAASAIYSLDRDRLTTHESALRQLDEKEALAQLGRWREQFAPPAAAATFDALRTLPKVAIPQPLGKPLYQRDMQSDGDGARAASDPPRRGGEIDHYIIPAVRGEIVYVNTGLMVRALDRSSLSDIWNKPFTVTLTDGSQVDRFGAFTRESRAMSDQRGVCVTSETVATIMGRGPIFSRGQWYNSGPDTLIVGLNRADGKLLWRRTPADIDEALSAGFFHGTPVSDGSRVYAAVRRAQNLGFRDAYVAAFEERTGKLLWRRHLSSCTTRYSNRSFSQILADRGRLYIADNLGAVTCIDGRTGAMLWLVKMSDLKVMPTGGNGIAEAPWQVSTPVLVKAGLIVSPFISSGVAMLLDPKTGKKLKDLDDVAFSQTGYLATAGEDVVSIGSTVQLFDGATLKSKWKLDLGEAFPPTGRAAITGDRLLVPVPGKLVSIDLADGRKISESPVDSEGNVTAMEGQVLVASGTILRSHVAWPVVYANLTSRIRKEPTDAQAGLALAHAALASHRPREGPAFDRAKEALEGADHVVAVLRHRALTRAPELRPEADDLHADIYQQMLKLVDPGVTDDVSLRGDLFDRLAKAAVTPRDQVQYHLAFGAHLADGAWPAEAALDRRREAARQFQTVLESSLLAAQLVPRGGGWQQAGIEARMKLAALTEKHGRVVYDEFDQRAAAHLERMLSAGDADPAALIELARKYPLARSTPAALLAAAESLAKGGKHTDAVTQLRRAFRERPDLALQARIIGRLVESYSQVGKSRRALQWLQRADRDNIKPIRGGQPVAAKAWLSELGSVADSGGARPALRPALGKPTLLSGRLLTPVAQGRDQWPADRVVLQAGENVELRGGPALDKVWEARLDADAQLLWMNETLVLFWLESSGRLAGLDARTGKRLWEDVRADALFKDASMTEDRIRAGADRPAVPDVQLLLVQGDTVRGRTIGLRVDGQWPIGEVVADQRPLRVAVNDAVACLADGRGRVLGIDIDTGQIAWRFICPFDRLDSIIMSAEAVTLVGTGKPNTEQESNLIVALDAMTGDVLCQLDPASRPAWIGLSDGVGLSFITQEDDRRGKSTLHVHQLPDGALSWKTELPVFRLEDVAQVGDSIAILADSAQLMLVDPANRKMTRASSTLVMERDEIIDLTQTGEQWHLLTARATALLNAKAEPAWRDGIDEGAGERVMQLLADELAVVATFPEQSGINTALRLRLQEFRQLPNPRLDDELSVSYNLFLVHRKTGAIVAEYSLPVVAARLDPSHCVLLKHRVVLGMGSRTLVIPDAAPTK